jgi:hypothetical protein
MFRYDTKKEIDLDCFKGLQMIVKKKDWDWRIKSEDTGKTTAWR